jgi:tetratricopeptide (TPR) repeat protein
MEFQEIDRLKERVDKDPNSKLFVPLAEEYKKAGMLDEAIDALTKGLARHPNYMSARVSLGKIYLEKGMLSEASAEFEKVVSAIPDNLYAHKKLAEIYRALSEREKAVEEFGKVLKLNPTDEDAAKSLAILEGRFTVQPEATEMVRAMMKEDKPSEVPANEPLKELGEAPFNVEEVLKETLEEQERLPEKEIFTSEDVFEESEIAVRDIHEALEKGVFDKSQINIGNADTYISQGRYAEALNVYSRLLSIEPSNVYVLQRLEELRALLKLLGRGKEELISRMNSFLDGIKKRQGEFFRTLSRDSGKS